MTSDSDLPKLSQCRQNRIVKMKYDVLCADTVDGLIIAVNSKIKDGWKLQGGIANLSLSTGYKVFYQAIYKD